MSPYRRPDRVAVARDPESEVIYLGLLPDGPILELVGSSAVIWETAISTTSDVAAAVAAEVGVERGSIADDVDAFLGELSDLGFIEPG